LLRSVAINIGLEEGSVKDSFRADLGDPEFSIVIEYYWLCSAAIGLYPFLASLEACQLPESVYGSRKSL
jgi:hypothetical protein